MLADEELAHPKDKSCENEVVEMVCSRTRRETIIKSKALLGFGESDFHGGQDEGDEVDMICAGKRRYTNAPARRRERMDIVGRDHRSKKSMGRDD